MWTPPTKGLGILAHNTHQGVKKVKQKEEERARPSASMLVCGVHIDSSPTSLLEEVRYTGKSKREKKREKNRECSMRLGVGFRSN